MNDSWYFILFYVTFYSTPRSLARADFAIWRLRHAHLRKATWWRASRSATWTCQQATRAGGSGKMIYTTDFNEELFKKWRYVSGSTCGFTIAQSVRTRIIYTRRSHLSQSVEWRWRCNGNARRLLFATNWRHYSPEKGWKAKGAGG